MTSHNSFRTPGGGGGGGVPLSTTQVQRGAAPALRISRKKGSFLRPPHVRDFVKEGYFFVPRYGGQNPLTNHEIYAAVGLTPSDSRSEWASEFAAATKHTEDYKILKLKYVLPFIQCQCFDKRRGVYLVEKNQRYIKIRALFWPEVSALGVFFNFDNECMRPPKYPSATPPPPPPPPPRVQNTSLLSFSPSPPNNVLLYSRNASKNLDFLSV